MMLSAALFCAALYCGKMIALAEDLQHAPVGQSDSAGERVSNWIEQFSADLKTLDQRYRVPLDIVATQILRETLRQWSSKLVERNFDELDRVSQTDYLLLARELEYRLAKLELDAARDATAAEFLPYAPDLVTFLKQREDVETIDPAAVASLLDRTAAAIEELTRQVPIGSAAVALPLENQSDPADATAPSDEIGSKDAANQASVSTQESDAVRRQLAALRACELLENLQRSLKEADRFYSGYDPNYTWWAAKPMERLSGALEKHRLALRESIVGVPDADQQTIIGLPIGSEGLALELRHAWIAHDPAELLALAEREMAWCDTHMAAAAEELGCSDDWRKAVELVKTRHVQPGEQPRLIRDLAWEAIRFLEAHDLVTIPPLAAGGWTMAMMSPEQQRVTPYFLGGDTIIVSFPTNAMTHDEKLMSMRSNNEHFARATVHHELIPGHHLQYYMLPRYRPYRELFATPFWMEGWALYWEMQLWDLDFARNAEDRVGMLFWRRHRCARIIFSLSYHLETMTPDECVDYLVQRVGHERSAAAAEVRRSIMGGYSPLYQAAYMLGGLQLRRLHSELVSSGKMTNRQFHDAVLHEHSIPIEVLRNYLTDQPLTRDTGPAWRFADE